MTAAFYEGRRIYFRPIELEDEPKLRAWINDPRNWATLYRCLPTNAKREREWIESLYPSDREVVLGIVVREGDRLIGSTGLHRIEPVHRSAELGLCIGDVDYQNHGYGSEATALLVKFGFDVLNLHRISLGVFADNPRAIRVYEKAGFVREGVSRERFFRNGRWHDEVRYAILRDEWLAAKQEATHVSEEARSAELLAAAGCGLARA